MENAFDETMTVTHGCDSVSRKRKAEDSPKRRSVNDEMNMELEFLQEQIIGYDGGSDDEDSEAEEQPVRKRRKSDHVNDLAAEERNEMYVSALNIIEIQDEPVTRDDRLYWVNTHPSPPSDMRPDTEADCRGDLSGWLDEQRRMLAHCSQDEIEELKTFAQTCKRMVRNRKMQFLPTRRSVGNEIRDESGLERSTGDESAGDGKPVSKKCEIEHENDLVAEDPNETSQLDDIAIENEPSAPASYWINFQPCPPSVMRQTRSLNGTSHSDSIKVKNDLSALASYWSNFQPSSLSVTQYPQDDEEEFREFV